MNIQWSMSGSIAHYEYEIYYRDDFGVWDYCIYDKIKNDYVTQGTQVGNPVWAMEWIDDWFQQNVK